MVSSSFLRHYDETKTFLYSIPNICLIGADGEHTGYEVMANVNKRPGEPDLILVIRMPSLPGGAEDEKRGAAMRDFSKQTDTQMEAASAERAKYRHVIGSTLWQVMNFK